MSRTAVILGACILGLAPALGFSGEKLPSPNPVQITPVTPQARPCSDLPGLKKIKSTGAAPVIEVFYNEKQEELARQLLTMAQQADGKLSEFFGTKLPSPYQIFIAKSNTQFSELTGVQYDWVKSWWVVGHSNTDTSHIIRDPSLWDPRSRKNITLSELIAHEMTHSYAMALSGTLEAKTCLLGQKQDMGEGPFWFSEGLAALLSGQLASWGTDLKFNFDNYPRFEQIMRPSGSYGAASTAVEYLLGAFGREKILEAIRKIPANSSKNLDESNRVLFDALGLRGEAKAMHEKKWKEAVLRKYSTKR